MFQWAQIRHMHLVEGVPKKEVARRLKLDVKTVRRAIARPTPRCGCRRRGRAASTRAGGGSGGGCARSRG